MIRQISLVAAFAFGAGLTAAGAALARTPSATQGPDAERRRRHHRRSLRRRRPRPRCSGSNPKPRRSSPRIRTPTSRPMPWIGRPRASRASTCPPRSSATPNRRPAASWSGARTGHKRAAPPRRRHPRPQRPHRPHRRRPTRDRPARTEAGAGCAPPSHEIPDKGRPRRKVPPTTGAASSAGRWGDKNFKPARPTRCGPGGSAR